jgi:hypothetical protein
MVIAQMAAIAKGFQMFRVRAKRTSLFFASANIANGIQMRHSQNNLAACPYRVFTVTLYTTAGTGIRPMQTTLAFTFALTLCALVANESADLFPIVWIFRLAPHLLTC